MKKRSLVAALAMLVVSAIVLTSSTYAWFAASTTASVSTISAEVQNSAGSIFVSPTGETGTWRASLSSADYAGLAQSLTPVSASVNTNDSGARTISFNGGNLAAGTIGDGTTQLIFSTNTVTANTQYLYFDVYLYAEVACTVEINPELSQGDINFGYGFVDIDKNYDNDKNAVVLGGTGDSYTPIVGEATATENIYDKNNNYILDANEATKEGFFGTTVSPDTDKNLSVTFSESQIGEENAVHIRCYVWAEGQDSDCKGDAIANVGMKLSFKKA